LQVVGGRTFGKVMVFTLMQTAPVTLEHGSIINEMAPENTSHVMERSSRYPAKRLQSTSHNGALKCAFHLSVRSSSLVNNNRVSGKMMNNMDLAIKQAKMVTLKKQTVDGIGILSCQCGLVGSTYSGQFDKGTFHGQGQLTLPNHDVNPAFPIIHPPSFRSSFLRFCQRPPPVAFFLARLCVQLLIDICQRFWSANFSGAKSVVRAN
jgi:hypothetical protein